MYQIRQNELTKFQMAKRANINKVTFSTKRDTDITYVWQSHHSKCGTFGITSMGHVFLAFSHIQFVTTIVNFPIKFLKNVCITLIFIVAYLLKAWTAEPERWPLLGNGSETIFVSRQRPQNRLRNYVCC
jgi:hypothetical protein